MKQSANSAIASTSVRSSKTITGSALYLKALEWLSDDWKNVERALGECCDQRFADKTILLTGAAGFLGFQFLHFFSHLNRTRLREHPITILAADNYLRGRPKWFSEISAVDENITSIALDITQPVEAWNKRFDFIIHGASVASPKFYRKYPLATLDANILGLRHMLDLARATGSESLLFFSSSEVYGDPLPENIPTPESYRGNVAPIGPRACYDESKRLGETLCWIYANHHQVPAKIVRPFNNYGPGLRIDDGRVISDFCQDALAGRNLVIHSDGSPTRTFCYAADALTGYLLVLLSEHSGTPFNIGSAGPEISMATLAETVRATAQSECEIIHEPSREPDYLTDNPNRRCPDTTKARQLVGFEATTPLSKGIARSLHWYREFGALDSLLEC